MNWRVSASTATPWSPTPTPTRPPSWAARPTCFDIELELLGHAPALRETGDGFVGTVEFFPEEGKYHLDGHRKCELRLEPDETRRHDGRCPACGRPLTVGVMHRVEDLADRPGPARGRRAPRPSAAWCRCPRSSPRSAASGSESKTVGQKVGELRLAPRAGARHPRAAADRGHRAAPATPLVSEAVERLRRPAGSTARRATTASTARSTCSSPGSSTPGGGWQPCSHSPATSRCSHSPATSRPVRPAARGKSR